MRNGAGAASQALLPPDPRTASALLKIATVFNHDYDRVFDLVLSNPDAVKLYRIP